MSIRIVGRSGHDGTDNLQTRVRYTLRESHFRTWKFGIDRLYHTTELTRIIKRHHRSFRVSCIPTEHHEFRVCFTTNMLSSTLLLRSQTSLLIQHHLYIKNNQILMVAPQLCYKFDLPSSHVVSSSGLHAFPSCFNLSKICLTPLSAGSCRFSG